MISYNENSNTIKAHLLQTIKTRAKVDTGKTYWINSEEENVDTNINNETPEGDVGTDETDKKILNDSDSDVISPDKGALGLKRLLERETSSVEKEDDDDQVKDDQENLVAHHSKETNETEYNSEITTHDSSSSISHQVVNAIVKGNCILHAL